MSSKRHKNSPLYVISLAIQLACNFSMCQCDAGGEGGGGGAGNEATCTSIVHHIKSNYNIDADTESPTKMGCPFRSKAKLNTALPKVHTISTALYNTHINVCIN